MQVVAVAEATLKRWFVGLAAAGMPFLAALTPAQQASEGQVLYVKYCAACHGQKGTPTRSALAQWPQLRPFSEPGFVQARSDDSIAAVTHSGVGKDMPARKDTLTREQMLAIARYVRSLGPPAVP
ncbi:MAG: cytochrome c [Gemmatimonadetes bacterium]|nr:cytochrome c [Gemmatimonadota bacterium]